VRVVAPAVDEVERGKHLLDQCTLHAAPAAVDEPDFREPALVRRDEVLARDVADVRGEEGVEVDRGFDRDLEELLTDQIPGQRPPRPPRRPPRPP